MARNSLARTLALAGAAAAAIPLGLLAVAPGVSASQAQTAAPLQLVAAAKSVTAVHYGQEPGVYLDLGTHIVAGKDPFEIRTTRKSYHDPIVGTQILKSGGVTKTKALPKGLVTSFSGFNNFFRLTVTDEAGNTVADSRQTWCPNAYETARTRPDAPSKSPYPPMCGDNPFTLGSVWGVQAGWAVNTTNYYSSGGYMELPDGKYTAKLTITKPYRDAFGIPASQSTATVAVTVRTEEDPGWPEPTPAPSTTAVPEPTPSVVPVPGLHKHGLAPKGVRAKPNKARPTGKASTPDGPRPDLRALPAWGAVITNGEDGGEPGHEYLAFSANVWNAGNSPLVVDGFRQPGADEMDAYQYFYDAKGQQIGWAPTGKLEYDARVNHEHWHFKDFASYRLLDAKKKEAVRSQKEAFCLAPTDAIDITIKGANWNPGTTDLHTACGGNTALAIREALDVGWGDTYAQFRPGQSFDITGLANGTYFIQVIANPENKLYESNTKNNDSYRKVILGGEPGARTVTVPPYELIDAP